MSWGEHLKRRRVGKSPILDEILVQKGRPTPPMTDDEDGRFFEFGSLDFLTKQELLEAPCQRIGHGEPDDHEGHPYPHEADAESISC